MNLLIPGRTLVGVALGAILSAGCSGGTGSPAMPALSPQNSVLPLKGHGGGILHQLGRQVVIGSTVDPVYGQLNPYGLDVAKSTSGAFTKGDLAVCNFNDNSNVQGTGYTIVALHPKPGSTPTLVVADPTNLVGCAALALTSNDTMYAAAFSSNGNPVYSSAGSLLTNLSGSPFNDPFGETYAVPKKGNPVVYESNAADGNIIRISTGGSYDTEVIATGFPVNGGPPGSILGPSGLQYNPNGDILYVVDGVNDTVTKISHVSDLHAGCLRVEAEGTRFGGKCKSRAKVIISGPPLNGPISSALLFNGSLVIGNTGNPSGENLMIEINPGGHVLDVRNVDKGASGALFGMVATGTNAANTKLYFNDDNDNNLQVLER